MPHALRYESGAVMANRRGKGEGSISQRPNGLWEARINVGTDATGKRMRKLVYGSTKKEVADKLTKLAHQKLDGTLIDTGRMTVGDLLDKWLEDSARLSVAPSTLNRYEGLVKRSIKPHLGTIKLSLLKPIHIQGMLSKLEQQKAGDETRRYSFQVLRRALNVAERWGLIVRNPCGMVDQPKVTRREISPLTVEQVQSLLKISSGHRLHALFVLAITSGLRQGELFAIHWADIDLKAGVLAVRYTLEEVKSQLRLKEPKSKSGRRSVKLPAMAVAALWEHKAQQLTEGLASSKLVFCDANGQFLRKSNFARRDWKPIRAKAEIASTVVFHDLRHTSASLLLATGAHPKVVQERLGHSKISLTMDTYSHLMPGMQDDAAAKLDIALRVRSA